MKFSKGIVVGFFCALMLFASQSCMALDWGKKKAGGISESKVESGMENEAPGSTKKVPKLTDDGEVITDEDGEVVMVYETSIIQDIITIINGGKGWGSFAAYLFAVFLIYISRLLGIKTAEKRLGSLVEAKNAALDIITSRINKAATNGKFSGIMLNLVKSIESSASRFTAVGQEIHNSAKRTEKHREGDDSITNAA